MKEMICCLFAFSSTLAITNLIGSLPENPIEYQRFRLMECERFDPSPNPRAFKTMKDRAAAVCFFGGYYPSMPATEL